MQANNFDYFNWMKNFIKAEGVSTLVKITMERMMRLTKQDDIKTPIKTPNPIKVPNPVSKPIMRQVIPKQQPKSQNIQAEDFF